LTDPIAEQILNRGITRLCHFTPSRSLAHILSGRSGIRPSIELSDDERAIFNPTDLRRLDNHASHICCSIEYPNGWYMARARDAEKLFPDWVVIFVKPTVLSLPGTLFCPRNAASGSGRFLRPGVEAFDSMYAQEIDGAYGRTYTRGPKHLTCSPTDDQAEVLVPVRIPVEDITGVAVSSAQQGVEERVRLGVLGIDIAGLEFVVAPTLFQKNALSSAIRSGTRPTESLLA
jgi:hypothetical protein